MGPENYNPDEAGHSRTVKDTASATAYPERCGTETVIRQAGEPMPEASVCDEKLENRG